MQASRFWWLTGMPSCIEPSQVNDGTCVCADASITELLKADSTLAWTVPKPPTGVKFPTFPWPTARRQDPLSDSGGREVAISSPRNKGFVGLNAVPQEPGFEGERSMARATLGSGGDVRQVAARLERLPYS